MSRHRIDRTLMQAEALARAESSPSIANFAAIFDGFLAKGIPMDAISPRENVFTYNAWQAKGRQVRKGEKGVKITTWIPIGAKTGAGSEAAAPSKKSRGMFPKSATVFHVTQTDPTQPLPPKDEEYRALMRGEEDENGDLVPNYEGM